MNESVAGYDLPMPLPGKIILFLLLAAAIALFLRYLSFKVSLVLLGKKEERLDRIAERVRGMLIATFGHGKVLKEAYPGLMHAFIFAGFLLLSVGYANMFLGSFLTGATIFGWGAVYHAFSFIRDLFGLLALVGVAMAAYRRYIAKPSRLDNIPDAAIILALITLVVILGLATEGIKAAITGDPVVSAAFVTGFFASLVKPLAGRTDALTRLYWVLWWDHLAVLLGFLVYIPISKHLHLVACPLNELFRSLKPKGALVPIEDIENAETFGVTKVEEYTWKQLLDAFACAECGRCQDTCPAHLSEKPLSPKKIHQKLKEHLIERGRKIIEARKTKAEVEDEPLTGKVFSEDELFACTTCGSCQEQCPVYCEHVQKIVDVRRSLVLMESRFPQEVVLAFKNMEVNNNPWGIAFSSRADWAKDLNVRVLSEGEAPEYLYWVGCAGSFDERNKKVSAAMVRLLKAAGIDFAILGPQEGCCGDSARRIGNEYLYQVMAKANIELLQSLNIKKIVTQCPHCYNALKNEYPQLGRDFQVVHAVELLSDLMKAGRLPAPAKTEGTFTYHDSCYLGRWNEIYEEPRDLVSAVSREPLREMGRTRGRSFCCGAGGGRMWMEEKIGKRINLMRAEEAKAAGATVVAVACPYCMTMFEDAAKQMGIEDALKVRDLAELLASSLPGQDDNPRE
jgi:Fe-S oxidoreductase/nitrate reductase gamma subunit